MDFEKLEPWQGKLAGDRRADAAALGRRRPVRAARRRASASSGEIPGSQLVAIEGVGHFVFDEAAERSVEEVTAFLGEQSHS